MKTRRNFVQIVFKCPTFSIPCSGMVYHKYESSYCCIIPILFAIFLWFLGSVDYITFFISISSFYFYLIIFGNVMI